ncbi:unnamed protein product [Rhizophagus irregularis]|nr:unnamed protein product [Rhizophagus irregularis]
MILFFETARVMSLARALWKTIFDPTQQGQKLDAKEESPRKNRDKPGRRTEEGSRSQMDKNCKRLSSPPKSSSKK